MSDPAPETDRRCRDLAEDLERDYAEVSASDLFRMRANIADEYMIYTVRPLPPYAATSAEAYAIRNRRRDFLAAVWLHLDALCGAR